MEVITLAEDGGEEYRAIFTSDSGRIPVETPFDVPVRHGTTVTITCRHARPQPFPRPSSRSSR
ncbi:hypothetical protein [Streptosporangium sp. NPDC000396]|uniref:hypothetical protein n=1 Tax=Streptosporangium sp. NPDC000396 TaxID=3366185 RepID=UPI00368996A2